jgi:hypothetical protein
VAVIVLAVVLAYGGVVHLVQLAVGGWPPYRWAPAWLAIYFTSLTVLDPLAAWMLMRRRVTGLYLAAGVLVTDATANWYATYGLARTNGNSLTTVVLISLLAIGSVVTARFAQPWFA